MSQRLKPEDSEKAVFYQLKSKSCFYNSELT